MEHFFREKNFFDLESIKKQVGRFFDHKPASFYEIADTEISPVKNFDKNSVIKKDSILGSTQNRWLGNLKKLIINTILYKNLK